MPPVTHARVVADFASRVARVFAEVLPRVEYDVIDYGL